jgi:phosphoribosylanthranilate isomerase
VLLDTFALSTLGGTGQPFDWEAVAGDVRDLRFGRCLIVAGGLRPENVRGAIDRLAPDVVDVSSGVEAAPGIKDQGKMAAFMTAVRQSVQ